jgi:hypothetical protein
LPDKTCLDVWDFGEDPGCRGAEIGDEYVGDERTMAMMAGKGKGMRTMGKMI